MRVNFSIGRTNLINVGRINQSLASRRGNNNAVGSSRAARRDKFSMGGKSGGYNPLENLMRQKKQIAEQKNSLISTTLESGGKLDSIKSQLETYDKQIRNIENQIASMAAQEIEQQLDKPKQKEKDEPKTEEEIQNERLADITTVSAGIKQAETIGSVQSKTEGSARVLKTEVEMDKIHRDFAMTDNSTTGASFTTMENIITTGRISEKEMLQASMEQKALSLTSKAAGMLSDVSEKTEEMSNPQEILPEDETEETDKLNELIPELETSEEKN